MAKYGKWVILIYALLMLGGGIGGFLKAHSMPSLISGIGSAAVLIAAFTMLATKPAFAYRMSLIVALALTLVFIERAVRTSAVASSMGRNIGLAVLSVVVAIVFGKCMQEST